VKPAAAGVPIGLGVYLTFSRSALGAVAAGMVVLFALAPQARPQLGGAVAVLGAAALAALVSSRLPAVESLRRGETGDAREGLATLGVLVLLAAAAAALVIRQPRRELRAPKLPSSRPAVVLTCPSSCSSWPPPARPPSRDSRRAPLRRRDDQCRAVWLD
jgi:hypothetical protein